MATEYKSEVTPDGNLVIQRDGNHVATYHTVEETLEWVEPEFQRFQNHVMREVNAFTRPPEATDAAPAPVPAPPVKPEPAPKAEEAPVDKDKLITQLRHTITNLRIKMGYQEDEIKKLRNGGISRGNHPRFSDPVDLTDAPAQDPNLGDKTPAFIDWARANMPREIFLRRYQGRIKDLSQPEKTPKQSK